MNNVKPSRCIDPIIKYCQGCQWGWIKYPEWVETREDLEGCSFEKGTDFSRVTKKQVAEIQNWMNSYPRRILGWKTPK